MTQVNAGTGFRYPSDLPTVLSPWQEKLGDEFESVVARLDDRDRALENYTDIQPVFDQVLAEEGTTSTTAADLGTVGPVVTVKLPRGSAIVHAGGTIESTTGGQQPQILLFIDGVQFQNLVAILNNQTANGIWITGGSTYLITGLSVDAHEFKLKYKNPTGTQVFFSNRFLQVTPVA